MTDPSKNDAAGTSAAGGGRLAGRVALVTGASRGIGFAVARRFAAEGAHVIATARTVGGLEELDDAVQADGNAITLAPVDLMQLDQVDVLCASVYQRFKKLDILIGNAGMLGKLTPMAHADPKEWQRVFTLNVHANQRLIRACDAVLRQSDAGRAVFVTSGAAQGLKPFWAAYGASKAALDAMVKTYAEETRKTNLRVNLISPGPVATGMRAQAFPGEKPETITQPAQVAELFVRLSEPACSKHGEIVRYGEN